MNNTPIPPGRQRQIDIARRRRLAEEKQKRIKRRRRQLYIMRAVVLAGLIIICVSVVLLVMKFIDHNTHTPEETADIPEEITTEQAETPEIVFDLSQLVDPSTLNPNDSISLDYLEDEVLPKVYSYSDTPYNTFSSDNPDLTSNTSTKVVVIDAGHQEGTRKSNVWLSPYLDPSKSDSWVDNSLLTIGTDGVSTKIPEYKTTHEIAEKLKTALEKVGYTVYLSHPDITEKLSGSERAAVANRNNADLMLSLHCDSYDEDKTVSGALALVPEIWDGYPSERLSYLSEKAAAIILDEYTTATGLKNRGYKPIIKSSMFSFCKVPIILLEMGFSSCPSDDKNMNDADFQEKMVAGIVSGINKYFLLTQLEDSAPESN